ncbi:MAG: hypothetical protein EBZ91_11405 [Gammaproteobacteria bacterium]|nr:hypothetical protein [Gammaproteobacteria bacterium]
MAGVQLSPHWAEGPQWPVVQQAAPVKAQPRPAPKTTSAEHCIVIAPDPQIGYRRYENGDLDPFHDDRAIALTLQIIRDAKPARIINLGDSFDAPEWSSKFLVAPEFVMTTQPALDRLHRYLAEQQTEAPAGTRIELLEGNHDARLGVAVTKNAMAAMRLRQANAPESWPVLSMQHLLRLDDLGVTYHDGYPAGRVKLAAGSDRITPLYAIHGERLTVSAVAKNERQSYVQGHIHRIQDHYETFELEGGPITVNAWSCGCLCRTDGAVPSVRGGADVRGRPIQRQEAWQQGCAVVTVQADGTWAKEIIHIANGRAIWRGKEYVA